MTDSLDRLALGFAVRTDGALDPSALDHFRRFAAARGVEAKTSSPERALSDAVERYRAYDALFVCGARPCAGAYGFDTGCDALDRVRKQVRMPTFVTGCQGHCKHKPVVSLRIGNRREMFGALTSDEDRTALFEHAKTAHALGSTLVPGNRVEAFRFDLEHGAGPTNVLPATRFLAGRFRGLGAYFATDYAFSKEVVGAYEPGGRFMTLHMEAHYPTRAGTTDSHRALVVVGSGPENGSKLLGRAFTDGGDVLSYDVDTADGRLAFDDRSPDHGTAWKRVRKILTPTTDGYEEHLLVDRGHGLEPYYRVVLRRVAPTGCPPTPAAVGQGCPALDTPASESSR